MTAPTTAQSGQYDYARNSSRTGYTGPIRPQSTTLGPFTGGLHNNAGAEQSSDDTELFELVNLEVDNDGTLVNRPAIKELSLSGFGATSTVGIKLIGTYQPEDGRNFIVASLPNGYVYLINSATGTLSGATYTAGVISNSCVQYKNNLYVISQSGNTGGYFAPPTSSTMGWTAVPTMPNGDAALIYKERLFICAGINAVSNTSRFWFSDIGNAASWPAINNIDVVPGNGQKLVSMLATNNDIILFKEHSTYKFGYSSDPAKADITVIDNTIGVPATNCSTVYNSNTIYVLHDNSVYELYNNVYTRISDKIAMVQVTDPSIYSSDVYGLTLYRDRLFIRYYSKLYVLSLKLQKWSSWETARKFSRIYRIPSASIGLDIAYAASATSALPGKVFYFQDDRISGIGSTGVSGETFQCRVMTKIYDFDSPTSYKKLFFGGFQIATSGTTVCTATIPNAAPNATWNDWSSQTWDSLKNTGITWAGNSTVTVVNVVQTALGSYARKVIKCLGKLSFRQIQFTFVTDAVTNTVGNSSVRIYDFTIYTSTKETLSKGTS